jgi:hypothetical protein
VTLIDNLETLILSVANDIASNGENCVNLRGLENITKLPREICRGICKHLLSNEMISHHKGLWSDDGEPAGSGYAITDKGKIRLQELQLKIDGSAL